MAASDLSPTPAEIEGAVARLASLRDDMRDDPYDPTAGEMFYVARPDRLAADLTTLLAALAQGREDSARLDWLTSQHVEVREPTTYGSFPRFVAQCVGDEDEPFRTSLREQVDAARSTGEGK